MKTYQSVLIGGLMALGLAACSSTGSNYHDSSSATGSSAADTTRSGKPMSGTHTDGSDNGADNNAGAGASNNATNTGMPVAPSAATSTSGGANR